MLQTALAYDRFTGWIVDQCPAPDKFAHTYAGLGIWLSVWLMLRGPRSSPMPLAATFLVELANECLDRVAHGSWMWSDTLGDFAATLFWPTLLTLAMRWRPSRQAVTATDG